MNRCTFLSMHLHICDNTSILRSELLYCHKKSLKNFLRGIFRTQRGSRPEVFCKKMCSENFCKNHRKTTVSESLFYKVAGLRPHTCNFIERNTLAQVLSCEFCKIFKYNFFYRAPPVASSEPSGKPTWSLLAKNS